MADSNYIIAYKKLTWIQTVESIVQQEYPAKLITTVVPDLSNGIITRSNNSDVAEGSGDPDGASIVLHHQAVDEERFHWRYSQLWDTPRQVRSKVVEGVLDAGVQSRIRLTAWQYVLRWKIEKGFVKIVVYVTMGQFS